MMSLVPVQTTLTKVFTVVGGYEWFSNTKTKLRLQFDENGNGTLEFPEFWAMVLTAMMSSPSSELNPSSQPVFYKLLQTFDEMDQNDDAVLSASELIAGMVGNKDTDVANETVQTILMETDDNRDGKLSFAEFVELVATMSKPDSYR